MKLVINTLAFVLFVVVLFHYPPDNASGQPGTTKEFKALLHIDSANAKTDSLKAVGDSIQQKAASYVASMEKQASTLPSKVNRLKESLSLLIRQNKKGTTQKVVYKTKYIPTLGPVNKSEYYIRMRKETDSLEALRQDSIKQAWANRSFFRKLFGSKPRKAKK